MVQRVTVSPSEVRGYGDIVSPKTTEDFYEYMCSVTESDGVYTLVYDETGTYLNLSASPTTVSYGGSVVFTAVLTQTGEPVEGETVSFYEGETLLGTDTTDSNGEATLTKSDFTVGSHSVKAGYDEVESSAVSVSVTKLAVTVSLSADSSSITYGSNVVLSGVLSLGSGVTVTIYDGTTSLGTVTTGTGGAFSKTVTTPSVGSHSFKVEYAGDTTHDSATASTSVTVNKLTSTITLASDKSVVASGETYTLSGVLSVGSGASVKIYNGNTLVDTVTTGTGGAFTKTITATGSGITNTYHAVFEGNASYEGVTSSNVSVYIFSDMVMELGVSGSSFSTYSNTPFTYTGNVFVDWGDNTIEEYTGGTLSHNYSSSGNYTVKIYGEITGIKSNCFKGCTGLLSVNLPNSVTTIGGSSFDTTGLTTITIPDSVTSISEPCFYNCAALTEIVLEWDSSSEIITYHTYWVHDCPLFSYFIIPEGTKSLYTAKNYPSNLLKEDGEPTPATITLTGTKSILSYADSESSVLTATVLDDNDDPVEGVSVDLYKDSVLWDTLTTGSAGTVSKTYTSAGVGDVGFTAECGSFVTERYTVEDCWAYHTTVTDSDSHFTKYTWGSNWYYLSNYEVPTGFKVIMKSNTNITNCQLGMGNGSGNYFAIQPINSKINIYVSTSLQTNVNFPTSANEIIYELVDSQTAKLYVDNTLVGTYTPNSNINRYIKAVIYSGKVYDMEYVKIKPL